MGQGGSEGRRTWPPRSVPEGARRIPEYDELSPGDVAVGAAERARGERSTPQLGTRLGAVVRLRLSRANSKPRQASGRPWSISPL